MLSLLSFPRPATRREPVLENPGKVQRFPKESEIFKSCSKLCCYYLEQSDSLPKRFSFHLFWSMKEEYLVHNGSSLSER